jgi:hypothetical protein
MEAPEWQPGGRNVPRGPCLWDPTWVTARHLMILQSADLRVRQLALLNLRTKFLSLDGLGPRPHARQGQVEDDKVAGQAVLSGSASRSSRSLTTFVTARRAH